VGKYAQKILNMRTPDEVLQTAMMVASEADAEIEELRNQLQEFRSGSGKRVVWHHSQRGQTTLGTLGNLLIMGEEIGFFALKVEPASVGWRTSITFPSGNGTKRLGLYSTMEAALKQSPGDFAALLRNEAADWSQKGS